MRPALCAILAVSLAACDAAAVDVADASAAVPRIQLGTGTSRFVELAARGDRLELVHGPQGGYHVDVAIRIWDLDSEGISIVYEVARVPGGELLSRTPFVFEAGRFVREDHHLVHTGDFTVLDISAPSDVVGAEIDLRVLATATSGRTATDLRRVTITDDR